jgi:hypothetical protein
MLSKPQGLVQLEGLCVTDNSRIFEELRMWGQHINITAVN